MTEDMLISEISKFETEESENGVNRQIGVISKNQLNKSLFARVVKNKKMLVFSCEEHRDSR